MVFRKPYAFLVKHFRKIHLGMSLIIAYLIYKSFMLLSFFNAYLADGWYKYSENLVSTYTSVWFYVLIGILIIALLAILLLMKRKKKPWLFYLIAIASYIVVIIGFSLATRDLTVLQETMIESTKAGLTRDIFLITSIFQFVVFIMCLGRGVGFDTKKFNFSADRRELEFEEADREEFEINIDLDSQSIKREIAKNKREFKVFFHENTFMILIIGISVIVAIVIFIILNTQVYNKRYKEGRKINVQEFSLVFNNTYVTPYDYRGRRIDKDKEFVVVSVSFLNNLKDNRIALSTNNFKLQTGNKSKYSDSSYYEYFVDFGPGYNGQVLEPQAAQSYILVFAFDKGDINLKDMRIIYTEDKTKTYGDRVKNVILKPELIDTIDKQGNVKLGKTLKLNGSLMKNSSFNIKTYAFVPSKILEYKVGKTGKTEYITPSNYLFENRTVMEVDGTFELDKLVYNEGLKTLGDVIQRFGTIYYQIEDETKRDNNIYNLTPNDYSGSKAYIECRGEITGADKITLQLNIRDKQYNYQLK